MQRTASTRAASVLLGLSLSLCGATPGATELDDVALLQVHQAALHRPSLTSPASGELRQEAIEARQDPIALRGSLRADAPNVIFVAGLEGAGHHVMHQLLNKTSAEILELPYPAWFCGRTWTVEGIQDMRVRMERLQRGRVYVLREGAICPTCQASYPCGEGGHFIRNLWHWPRLDWIAQAASEAGVALHVVLLYRSFDDCLSSRCLHYKLEPCDLQAQTLKSVGSILAGQINEFTEVYGHVNSNTISCVRYGDLDSMEFFVRNIFGEGAHPAQLVNKTFKDYPPQGMRESVSNWDQLVLTMQQTESELHKICAATR